MNKDLQSYVKIYHNFYESDFCKDTVRQLQNTEFAKHHYVGNDGDRKTHANDLSVSYNQIANYGIMANKIWHALNQYISKDINLPWLQGWTGYTPPRFNRYEVGEEMRVHCDHISDIFDGNSRGIPLLTVLGMLNEGYEGGEFIMFEDTIIPLKEGDVIIFPSIFLYPHKVEKVTKGTRYSFVSWVW